MDHPPSPSDLYEIEPDNAMPVPPRPAFKVISMAERDAEITATIKRREGQGVNCGHSAVVAFPIDNVVCLFVHLDEELNPDEARQVAAALIKGAEACERS